jgi:hypothetical protein
MAKLKLVVSNEYAPRPIKVYYEGGGVGSCKTIRNAIVAATRQVIFGSARTCNIYSEGIHVCDVVRSGNQVLTKWRKGTIGI